MSHKIDKLTVYNGLKKRFEVYQLSSIAIHGSNRFSNKADYLIKLFINKEFKTHMEAENALDEWLVESYVDEFEDQPIPSFTILPIYIPE